MERRSGVGGGIRVKGQGGLGERRVDDWPTLALGPVSALSEDVRWAIREIQHAKAKAANEHCGCKLVLNLDPTGLIQGAQRTITRRRNPAELG